MKFTIFASILAALPAWAVTITNSNFDNIEVGKPFEITWSGATGPVTLTLKDGSSDNLQTVGEITSGQTGESYTWVPDSSLSTGTYALEINDGTDVNYSKQFDVEGGSASSTPASITVSSTLSTSIVSSTIVSSTISSTSISSASATTSSASESLTSSLSSSSSSATVSGSSTSSTTSASSTSSASHTSSTSAATIAPNTNAAQTMAPFMAPMLLAVGAALM
ncbi:Ser-Thr-rich glycosyl-phosphatidyl-inositol-anchored membrane family-domain-containing protein [Hypoxylon sp. FL0890]|nr:Ser-Thr-rich glycosyl-phosphatidyl-inositol-anchored membrane family-domain-containing protein [Hypoxylon sp. FL0890]